MRVSYSDNAIKGMVKDGIAKEDATFVLMAIQHPESRTVLSDGKIRFDGFGTSVIGRQDRTGKFFTVTRVKVDKRP